MPRGKRETTLIALVNQLDKLDAKRRKLVGDIQAAAGQLASGVSTQRGWVSSGKTARGGGRRPGFKMSAEARAKIAAAQRKRWAKQKAEKK